MNTVNANLKPCPFCGGTVRMIKGFIKGTNTVLCDKCGADVMFFGADHDVLKFIRKWNSRKAEREEA